MPAFLSSWGVLWDYHTAVLTIAHAATHMQCSPFLTATPGGILSSGDFWRLHTMEACTFLMLLMQLCIFAALLDFWDAKEHTF